MADNDNTVGKKLSGFIPNLVDRTGRPVFLPKTITKLPEHVFEVTNEVFTKVLKGEPRVYTNDKNQVFVHRGGGAWLPTANPGKGWNEVTDPDQIKSILAGHSDDQSIPKDNAKTLKPASAETTGPAKPPVRRGKHIKPDPTTDTMGGGEG